MNEGGDKGVPYSPPARGGDKEGGYSIVIVAVALIEASS